MELEIVLDSGAGKPLYEQIYQDIRERIRGGEITAGERLPSTRVMAMNLHVARSTAELAYEQLEAEGYVEIRPGSGAYVCDIEHIPDIGDVTRQAGVRDEALRRGGAASRGSAAISHGNMPFSSKNMASPSSQDMACTSAPGNAAASEGNCGSPREYTVASEGNSGSTREYTAASEGNSGSTREYAAAAGDNSGRSLSLRCSAGSGAANAADDSDFSPHSRHKEIRVDFSPRTIDMSVFPYATWRRIMRGILTGDRADLFSRGDPQGDLGLRTTIARYLHLSRGCRCTPEQIVIGAGNDYLMMLLAMVLGEGRRIGMESPTYLRAAGIASAMRDEVVPIRSDTSGMDIRALSEADCSLAYVMPTRQYPTGAAMPWPRRSQLLKWAAAAPDRYIIEDDYDSEFKYRGRPVPSLQSQDTTGRVIYMGTFSKSIAPAIRVSYLILPEGFAEIFRARAGILSCTVPRMDQAILDEFIRDGYFERHLNRMRSRYRAKHDLMLEVLDPLTAGFEIRGAGAGLHLVLEVKGADSGGTGNACKESLRGGTGGNAAADPETAQKAPLYSTARESARERNLRIENEFAEKAADAGVAVYPMSEAYLDGDLPAGQKTPPSILLGYAALTEDEIRSGAAALIAAWT